MSKIGNSLDNCEAKYFFSNIKSECLNHIKTNKMTVDETKLKVEEYSIDTIIIEYKVS